MKTKEEMKNFKTERKRLEKGCGKETMDDESNEGYFCSKFNGLCSTCQAKLTQLNEDEEICREKIDNIGASEDECDIHPTWAFLDCPIATNLKKELKQNLFGGENV